MAGSPARHLLTAAQRRRPPPLSHGLSPVSVRPRYTHGPGSAVGLGPSLRAHHDRSAALCAITAVPSFGPRSALLLPPVNPSFSRHYPRRAAPLDHVALVPLKHRLVKQVVRRASTASSAWSPLSLLPAFRASLSLLFKRAGAHAAAAVAASHLCALLLAPLSSLARLRPPFAFRSALCQSPFSLHLSLSFPLSSSSLFLFF